MTTPNELDAWLAEEAAIQQLLSRGPDGTLYAHATATCLVFDRK